MAYNKTIYTYMYKTYYVQRHRYNITLKITNYIIYVKRKEIKPHHCESNF